MTIQKDDQVLVNVAPFVGSLRRSKESVPCRVLALDGPHVQVETNSPYRTIVLWVLSSWIDDRLTNEPSSSTGIRENRSQQRRPMMVN